MAGPALYAQPSQPLLSQYCHMSHGGCRQIGHLAWSLYICIITCCLLVCTPWVTHLSSGWERVCPNSSFKQGAPAPFPPCLLLFSSLRLKAAPPPPTPIVVYHRCKGKGRCFSCCFLRATMALQDPSTAGVFSCLQALDQLFPLAGCEVPQSEALAVQNPNQSLAWSSRSTTQITCRLTYTNI